MYFNGTCSFIIIISVSYCIYRKLYKPQSKSISNAHSVGTEIHIIFKSMSSELQHLLDDYSHVHRQGKHVDSSRLTTHGQYSEEHQGLLIQLLDRSERD